MQKALRFALLVALFACTRNSETATPAQTVEPVATAEIAEPHATNFTKDWYRDNLIALDEPPFGELRNGPHDTIRLIWLRSFFNPIAISASVGTLRVRCKEVLPSAAPLAPRALRNDVHEMTRKQWDEIEALVESGGFWSEPGALEPIGDDGAHWIVEAAFGDKYNVVDRWSPKGGVINSVGLKLIDLCGPRPDPTF